MVYRKTNREKPTWVMRAVIWSLLLLAPFSWGGSRIAQSQGLQELIRTISEKQRQIETLTGNFVQRRETSLMQEPLLSAGIVKFKRPGRIYFVYSRPAPMEISLNGKFLTIYDPRRPRVERYALSPGSAVASYMESVTRIFQRPLDQLSTDYSVHPVRSDRADC